jgi:hypothetical protein
MDAIQRLRAKAEANNKLTSTKEQTVKVQQVQNRQVIAIEPTEPDTVYVPYYDPAVVYGDWPYSDYPPYYFPPPGYISAGIIATGIAFGVGYALRRWASGGNYWGGSVNWGGNNININRPINGAGTNWQRRVEHRQGAGNRGGRQQGLNFRGSGGQQVLKGGRTSLGERNRPSKHPSAAHRGAGTRGSAGARSSRGGATRHHAAARPLGGRASAGGGGIRHGGGVAAAHRGFGGMHGGGMRGGGMRGGRGGGRRSDIRVKHDITLLGHLDDGLGFYRFSYNGSNKAYVGVIAQDVQQVMPEAVVRGRDGFLWVYYEKLGLKFESYKQWVKSGAQIPHGGPIEH